MNLVLCPSCDSELQPEQLNRDLHPCSNCHHRIQVEVFPAGFKDRNEGAQAEAILTDGEASCFYHAEKKAAVSCDRCGRFLCGLCDIELNGEHICSSCIESGRKKGKIQTLENRRTLYDHMAFGLAVFPLITVLGILITCITAPWALYLAIRHRKSPGSIVGATKWRYYVAGALASLQIVSWLIFILGQTDALNLDF